MNIFEDYLIKIENTIKKANQDNLLELPENLSGINVDIPPAKFNGDVSTNVAMVLSKINKKPPIELAEIISGLLKKNDKNIDHISIEKPGFINLKFKKEFWTAFILDVLNKPSYGSNLNGKKNSFLVEFVSANPTGPLHVGHTRGAVFGDALSELLSFAGYEVTREYYINDGGSQVDTLARSVYLRYLEAHGQEVAFEDGTYPGNYLIPVGQALK